MAALGISPYPRMIYEQIDKKVDFEKAISMCRFVNDKALWACLAAMSIYFRELDTTEIALAAIDEADKVHFINHAMTLPSEPSKSAAIALYCKKYKEAEQILLQARLFYRAIKMNIKMFKWDRALEIAVQNKTHVDTVIAYRQRYLEKCGRPEDNQKFLQYSQDLEIDWPTIKEKIRADKEREA